MERKRKKLKLNAQEMLDSLIAIRDGGKDLSKLDVIVIVRNDDQPVYDENGNSSLQCTGEFEVYYAHKCTHCGWTNPESVRVGAFRQDKVK